MMIIGIDTGGTFTDFVYGDEEGLRIHKCLSSPSDPAEAVLSGIRHIAGDRQVRVIHGSTVATNAILEKKGAKTALITNRGFEDIIEIGRQNRTQLYNLTYRKNPSLVPRHLRFGLKCRTDCLGNNIEDINDDEIMRIVAQLEKENAESVAVSFLFSFENPEHELRVREILGKTFGSVSLSHEILSEFREYERTSTTVINAYIAPKMKAYITRLAESVGETRLSIMQSNGGSISAATAMNESVRTILSGPAGGAVGAFEIGKMAGFGQLITFDMGGTSTDVALIGNSLPLTMESNIAGYPVKVPMIDIHTVGAGGGSIAYMDAGGLLRVGPESAGAIPGPICYGKGKRITVTDANLYLGRLIPAEFLGGTMRLETDRLEYHFGKMANEIGLAPAELAEGILAVANATMERAIRVISVERGHDPRMFALFSFGGAGGLHAAFLAKLLGIPKVFVPKNPGILSAMGMLLADVIKDYSRTVMLRTTDVASLDDLFEPLEKQGFEALIREGIRESDIHTERYLDMRYVGQSYEIIVPHTADFRRGFDELHNKAYGYRSPDKDVEIVNIRLRARGIPDKPVFERHKPDGSKPCSDAVVSRNPVIFDGIATDTDIIRRERLRCGNVIRGPAIITEYSATTVIPPNCRAEADEFENLIMTLD